MSRLYAQNDLHTARVWPSGLRIHILSTILEAKVLGRNENRSNDVPTSYPEGFGAVAFIGTVVEDELLVSCGGTIISSRTVLTSARCMLQTFETYIIAGSQSINLTLPFETSSASGGQIKKATKVVVHEKFRNESEYDYDVALASFDEQLSFGDSLSFIALRWHWARLEEPVFMFGWKHSVSDGKLSVDLRWAQTSMACRSKGKDLAGPGAWDNLNIYTDGVIFVKDRNGLASTCHGDSGSPLVQEGTQIGFASFGVDYDCKGLNAISSIRRHLRWIEKKRALLEGEVQNHSEKQELITKAPYRKTMSEMVSYEKVFGSRKSQASSSVEPRIKNGTRVESPETFPFMAALAIYFTDDPAKYNHSICGGSILTQWIILSAAHCIAHNLSLIVYAGIIDQSNFTEKDQLIRVRDYRVSPHYYYGFLQADIGLVLLSSPLKFNTRVAPICQLTMKDLPDGTPLHIAGWGYLGDEAQTLPSYLSVTQLVMRKDTYWTDRIDFDVTTTSACLHDSGSPYFNEEHEVAAVQSSVWPGREVKTCKLSYVTAISTASHYNWTMEALQELEALVEE